MSSKTNKLKLIKYGLNDTTGQSLQDQNFNMDKIDEEISDVKNVIGNLNGDAQTLNGHDSSYFAAQTDLDEVEEKLLPQDAIITLNRTNGVLMSISVEEDGNNSNVTLNRTDGELTSVTENLTDLGKIVTTTLTKTNGVLTSIEVEVI